MAAAAGKARASCQWATVLSAALLSNSDRWLIADFHLPGKAGRVLGHAAAGAHAG